MPTKLADLQDLFNVVVALDSASVCLTT